MKRGFKAKAEKTSLILREKMGLKHYERIDCFQLANKLKAPVIDPRKLEPYGFTSDDLGVLKKSGSAFSAVTIKVEIEGIRKMILYNPFHSKLRTRSSIAHELAHIILKHEFSSYNKTQQYELIREYPAEDEEEADWLAGCILIPRKGLVWAGKRGMPVKDIAKHFKTSKQMARWRYNMTGVAKQMQYMR